MIADFLKPPTDNLYKFMCICGLILFLLSATYPPWLLNKIARSYLENVRDYEMLSVDLEQTNHLNELSNLERDSLNKDRSQLSQQLESLKNSAAAKSPLTPTDKMTIKTDLDQLAALRTQLEEKDRKWTEKALASTEIMVTQRKKLIGIRYANEAALWEVRSAVAITVLALFGVIAGVLLMRKGFNLWSLRVQVFEDAILRRHAEQETKEKS